MGYGFWDGMADLATGGAYSATKAAVGVAEDATAAATGAVGGIAGAVAGALEAAAGGAGGTAAGPVSGTGGTVVVGKELRYCSYVIDGDYLLNSETGQVWLIDKQKRELLPIKRCKFLLEGIATAVQLQAKRQFLLERKDLEIGRLPQATRKDFSSRIDKLMEALDKEIADNMKS